MPPSSEKPKPGKCKGRKKPHILNEADLKEIENICSNFTYDEMTFKEWTEVEKNLNLVIPINLSRQEAEEGTVKEISWSRVIETTQNDVTNSKERQRVIKTISFPPKIEAGWSVLFEGLGDARDERFGNARILVRIV